MPCNKKDQAVRRFEQKAASLAPDMENKLIRRFALGMLNLTNQINQQRYINCPKGPGTYNNHHYLSVEHARRLDMSNTRFKFVFWCSKAEFDRLVNLFGEYQAFKSTGRKAQATAKLQLAVAITRLAHNTMMAKLAKDFDISGG